MLLSMLLMNLVSHLIQIILCLTQSNNLQRNHPYKTKLIEINKWVNNKRNLINKIYILAANYNKYKVKQVNYFKRIKHSIKQMHIVVVRSHLDHKIV